MRQTFLTNDQLLFLQQEKQILTESLSTYAQLHVPEKSLDMLKVAIAQLDELFMIVVVGEFNAGKSALINALLGERVLAEGVTPTTARVTLVRWGEQAAEQVVDEGFAIVTYPLDLLKELNIVDSPGTNSINRQHERLTNDFVPRSDLVLFITSADRALTESERIFLERILSWGKKVTLVINKADIFEDEKSAAEVRQFVSENAAGILGTQPEVFVVSARLAQKANLSQDPSEEMILRQSSGFDQLESYIKETLSETARLELKLRNPSGVSANLQKQALQINQDQKSELQEDDQLVAQLEGNLLKYKQDLEVELKPRLAEVENILTQFEMRGQVFFDQTLRLANIRNLLKSEKIKADFQDKVMMDVPQEIDAKVRAMIDWLVDKDLNEWYQVSTSLERRQHQNLQQTSPVWNSPQTERRKELIANVSNTIKLIVGNYNREKEAEELAALVQDSVAQTALFGAGAVGLGALVATALFSSAMDVTGTVAAGTLAILGLFVIPNKRRQAKESFKEKMDTLRTNLMTTLTDTFNREKTQAISRLSEAITPYTQYVHSEEQRIEAEGQQIMQLEQQLQSLSARIKEIL